MALLLIDRGAAVNKMSYEEGETPLFTAATVG